MVGSLFIVGIVEIGTGIIASSLTTLRPLLKSCAGYKITVRSYLNNRSSKKSANGVEAGKEDARELDEVTYHDRNLKHTTINAKAKSDTSEEALWSPYKETEENDIYRGGSPVFDTRPPT
jgi:hypothetical protein